MSSFTYQLYALTIEAHGEAKTISSKKLFRYDALNIKLVSLIRHDKFGNIITPFFASINEVFSYYDMKPIKY